MYSRREILYPPLNYTVAFSYFTDEAQPVTEEKMFVTFQVDTIRRVDVKELGLKDLGLFVVSLELLKKAYSESELGIEFPKELSDILTNAQVTYGYEVNIAKRRELALLRTQLAGMASAEEKKEALLAQIEALAKELE